jgi:hypothetical protein
MPRVKLSVWGKVALYALRIYLVGMLALILWKFIHIVAGGHVQP